ncbi:DoxX family protein [Rubrivivax sp. RP6-9]|uniref:DoxX family protein n=1 Tax=Rubrivivax sp. RP6-9 TaxID=3415750 RepID=UPI003CC63DB2
MWNPIASPLLLVGRALLGVLFIAAGPAKIANPAATAGYMASGGLPASAALAVLVGVFEIVAGLALALGLFTRWAALALALFTLVASVLFHAYWQAPAEQQFVQQLLFMKNLGVVGGLLLLVGVGAGAWSWDARRRAAPGGAALTTVRPLESPPR